jgi:DNA-binding NarL/FixJ family response regulator
MLTPEKTIRILIADNQFLITESLKYLLLQDGRFLINDVVSEAENAKKILTTEEIALLIIDPVLTGTGNAAGLNELIKGIPELKVLLLVNSITRDELNAYNRIGLKNIIYKTEGKSEITAAVNATLSAKKYYSDGLLEMLFEDGSKQSFSQETNPLTVTELEIVRLISEGMTTREIAAAKFKSHHTVITHRKNIFRKLGVTSISELIMFALRAGWINTIEYHI